MLELRKVSRGYQVTLPRTYRDKFHLEIGDMLEFVERDDELIIRPLKTVKKENTAKRLIEFLKRSKNLINDISENELLKLVYKERKKIRTKNKETERKVFDENSH